MAVAGVICEKETLSKVPSLSCSSSAVLVVRSRMKYGPSNLACIPDVSLTGLVLAYTTCPIVKSRCCLVLFALLMRFSLADVLCLVNISCMDSILF